MSNPITAEELAKERAAFRAAWPELWKQIQNAIGKDAEHATHHHAAWIVWCAARGIK